MSIRLSRMVLTAFAVSLAAAAALGPAPVARASGYATISGSGSSWKQSRWRSGRRTCAPTA